MKKIAFMAHGPGSGNVLKPLIDYCRSTNLYDITLYAFHPFVANLWACEEREKKEYLSLFDEEVDVIFYGTGSGHEMERKVPFHAKEKAITTVSILDAFWSDEKNLRFRYEHPPDFLIVPEESSKKRIVENGLLTETQVFSFGNPHFDRLKSFQCTTKRITPPYDLVLFSQPTTTNDFSETDITVKDCLVALNEIKKTTRLISSITVTPHPREDITWLSAFCNEHNCVLETERSSFEVMLEKDLNVGVNCTLQYESQIIGIPTIFYANKKQLEEHLRNPFGSSYKKLRINFNATDLIFNWVHNWAKNKQED